MPSRTPHLVQPDSSLTFVPRIQDASRASRMCYVTVVNSGPFHPRAGPFHTPAFRGDVYPTPTPSMRFRSWDWVPDPRPCVCPPAVGTGPVVAQGPSQPGQGEPGRLCGSRWGWNVAGLPSRAGEERAGLDAGLGIIPTPRCARCLLRALGRASGLQPAGPRGHQPAACPGWGGRHAAEGPEGGWTASPSVWSPSLRPSCTVISNPS